MLISCSCTTSICISGTTSMWIVSSKRRCMLFASLFVQTNLIFMVYHNLHMHLVPSVLPSQEPWLWILFFKHVSVELLVFKCMTMKFKNMCILLSHLFGDFCFQFELVYCQRKEMTSYIWCCVKFLRNIEYLYLVVSLSQVICYFWVALILFKGFLVYLDQSTKK